MQTDVTVKNSNNLGEFIAKGNVIPKCLCIVFKLKIKVSFYTTFFVGLHDINVMFAAESVRRARNYITSNTKH